MTVTREAIAAEARSWLGTPFHHQGRRKGVGVDCVGLLIGVGRDLGLPWKEVLPYAHVPDGASLRRGIAEQLDEIPLAEAGAGDVVLFWVETETRHPQHLAILTELLGGLGMVHAYFPLRTTVECSFTDEWRSRAVVAWRFRLG